MTQRDRQWIQDRLGRITASRFGDAMAKQESQRYQRYRDDLIDERIGLINVEEYIEKPWFRHGRDMEPRAIEAYAFYIAGFMPDAEVIPLPQFIKLDGHGFRAGASPDVIVMLNGRFVRGAEVKCRIDAATQWKAINSGMESVYKPQVHGNIMVAGAQQWDFVNFCEDERLDPKHRLHVHHVYRDDAYIERIESCLRRLDAEVQEQVDEILAAMD